MSDTDLGDILPRIQILVTQGRLEEGRTLAGDLPGVAGGSLEDWLLAGNLSGQIQSYDVALECFTRATNLGSSDPRAYSGLANACYAAGNLDCAVSAGRKLVELQPDNADSWYFLATIFGAAEDFVHAEDCLRRVIEHRPGVAHIYRSMGCMLQAQGKLDEALGTFQKAIDCDPEYADACNDCGVVLQEMGRLDEALIQYNRALQINPDFVDAKINLGSLLMLRYDLEGAQHCFESVLSADSNNTMALSGLGTALLERGKLADAEHVFNRALGLDPGFDNVVVKLARLHERQGDYRTAQTLLQPIIDKGRNADAVAAFAQLAPRIKATDRAIEMLEDMLTNGSPLYAQKMEMYYSLGRRYEKVGSYDAAFENFKSGNELKQVNYNHSGQVQLVESLVQTYSMKNVPGLPSADASDRQPLFIVGMPRSGTSLAEQILSVHPDVQAAGELIAINKIAAELHQCPEVAGSYPGNALFVDRDTLGSLVRKYLDDLPDSGKEKKYFTDKMPHNFLHLGLIQQLFPNARIIHCVRDPRDTCLSCYSYDFSGDHPYAYSLESLGRYYLQYRRLMDHWKSVLKLPIYDLVYEQLIDDQDAKIRDLVSFCGLDWDDRCLGFHSSGRYVRTSSYDQVRRPIYSSSIGKWKHYEEHLGPLLDMVDHVT